MEKNHIMLSLTICTPYQIEKNKMEGACRTYEERSLVGKTERKRKLGRPKRSWEEIIKMDLQEVGRGAMDRIDLSQDRDRF
jgi:hypothetical protein